MSWEENEYEGTSGGTSVPPEKGGGVLCRITRSTKCNYPYLDAKFVRGTECKLDAKFVRNEKNELGH